MSNTTVAPKVRVLSPETLLEAYTSLRATARSQIGIVKVMSALGSVARSRASAELTRSIRATVDAAPACPPLDFSEFGL